MNCRNFQTLVYELAQDRAPADLARAAREHLAGCPACRYELLLARKLESALASQKPRVPDPGFTERVLAALPAHEALPATLRSQMATLAAYAVTSMAILAGLSRFSSLPHGLQDAWSARVSTLSLILGLQTPERAGEPGRLEATFQWFRNAGEDLLAFLSAYGEQVLDLYSAHAMAVNLTLGGLALVWALLDLRRQKVRA